MQQGFLSPNDELRLDAVRFLLIAPGMEMNPAPASAPEHKPSTLPAAHKMQMWASIMLTVAALAVIVLLVMKR